MKSFVLSAFLSLVWVAGLWAAPPLDLAGILRSADEITLYSIVPLPVVSTDLHGNPTEEDKKVERIHGYSVLGKLTPPDQATRDSIRRAALAATTLPPSTGEDEAPSMCFDPRHVLCLKHGQTHYDLLLCFECGKGVAIFEDHNQLQKIDFYVGPGGLRTLNALLDAQKIPRDHPRSRAPEKKSP